MYLSQLTGIIQDMVDGKKHLEDVLKVSFFYKLSFSSPGYSVDDLSLQDFYEWMTSEGLLNEGVSFIFVTCGDWDLKRM
jgi:ERI1 exoribonuclease 3